MCIRDRVCERLNLPHSIAEEAVKRLVSIGYIKIKNNQWFDCLGSIETEGRGVTTDPLRNYQLEISKIGRKAIESHGVEKRSTTGMTMAIDPRKLEHAKEMIENFQQRLCNFLASGEKTHVYQLQVNLFSLEESF